MDLIGKQGQNQLAEEPNSPVGSGPVPVTVQGHGPRPVPSEMKGHSWPVVTIFSLGAATVLIWLVCLSNYSSEIELKGRIMEKRLELSGMAISNLQYNLNLVASVMQMVQASNNLAFKELRDKR